MFHSICWTGTFDSPVASHPSHRQEKNSFDDEAGDPDQVPSSVEVGGSCLRKGLPWTVGWEGHREEEHWESSDVGQPWLDYAVLDDGFGYCCLVVDAVDCFAAEELLSEGLLWPKQSSWHRSWSDLIDDCCYRNYCWDHLWCWCCCCFSWGDLRCHWNCGFGCCEQKLLQMRSTVQELRLQSLETLLKNCYLHSYRHLYTKLEVELHSRHPWMTSRSCWRFGQDIRRRSIVMEVWTMWEEKICWGNFFWIFTTSQIFEVESRRRCLWKRKHTSQSMLSRRSLLMDKESEGNYILFRVNSNFGVSLELHFELHHHRCMACSLINNNNWGATRIRETAKNWKSRS